MIETPKKNNLLTTLILLAFFILCATVFAGFIGYGKGGFDVSIILTQFMAYASVAIGGVLVIFIFFFANMFLVKGNLNKSYGDYLFFNSPGEGPAILTDKFRNPLKLFLLSLIIFSILGLVATHYQQTYLGVGTLKQQFTVADGIMFNWFEVVTSENMGVAALVCFTIFLLRRTAYKNNWGKSNFITLSVVIVLIEFAVYGFINHQLRYGAVESSIQSVLVFWLMLGAITLISGSFIPAFVAHGMNNTFVELSKNFTSDIILYYTIAMIVVMIVLYFILFIRGKKHEI
jgi:hypothetical protein